MNIDTPTNRPRLGTRTATCLGVFGPDVIGHFRHPVPVCWSSVVRDRGPTPPLFTYHESTKFDFSNDPSASQLFCGDIVGTRGSEVANRSTIPSALNRPLPIVCAMALTNVGPPVGDLSAVTWMPTPSIACG